MARLFGVPAASPATARVLELGCGTGANLLPMADAFPLASFVGVDPVAASIDLGRRFAKAAGLTNVEFRNEDFTAFSAPGKTFDYIIVHGVFSRVPEETRKRLWEICQAHLAPQGIAYFSYDVLPGANMRRSVREIAQFHTSGLTDPATKVKQARSLLKFLADAVPGDDQAYGVMLRDELTFATKVNDRVVFHDYLAPDRSAVYFHEFVAQAAGHGLQFLCESTLSDMLAANFPEAVNGTLNRITNVLAQEQYIDFLRNRMMRQTLLCPTPLPIQRAVGPDVLRSLAFQAAFNSNPQVIDVSPGATVVISGPAGQQVSTSNPFTKAILSVLSDYALRAVGFNELLEGARARSRPHVERPAADLAQQEESAFAATLLNLLSKGFIDVQAEAGQPLGAVPAKPQVSAFHRLQARADLHLTSHLNVAVPLDILGRILVSHCDGTRTVDELIDVAVREAQTGRIKVEHGNKTLRDEAKLRAALGPQVRTMLDKLARGNLLLAPTPTATTS